MNLKKLIIGIFFLGTLFFILHPPVVIHAAPPTDLKCLARDGTTGINTAIGCISTDSTKGGFVSSIMTVAIGIGGALALILMLYSTFIITTSAGIPDKLNQGKEILSSAITGLVFIILSIVLLQLIGVTIIGLPGL